jgi:D-alanine-D-alanine ligase
VTPKLCVAIFNLIEEYIEGREIYAAVLGNDPPEALPLIELDPSKLPKGTPKIASFDVKFDESTEAYKKTSSASARDLDDDVVAEIQRVAVTAFRALHLRDYARIDLRLGTNGRIYLFEANPNPWLAPIAEFAMAAKESGRSYTEMIDAIVKRGGWAEEVVGGRRWPVHTCEAKPCKLVWNGHDTLRP